MGGYTGTGYQGDSLDGQGNPEGSGRYPLPDRIIIWQSLVSDEWRMALQTSSGGWSQEAQTKCPLPKTWIPRDQMVFE